MTKKSKTKKARRRVPLTADNFDTERIATLERAEIAADSAHRALNGAIIDASQTRLGQLVADEEHLRRTHPREADAIASARIAREREERTLAVEREESSRLVQARNAAGRLVREGRELMKRLGLPENAGALAAEDVERIRREERERAERLVIGRAPWQRPSPDLHPDRAAEDHNAAAGITPQA